jgi:DNA invertase Pin-like site-specific DNA recombinase
MTKPIRAALYVRVSTTEQSTKPQENELRAYAENRGWVVKQIYTDKISGAKEDRPGLAELMAACRQRRVDVVLVWKFDRFARSVSHLLQALEVFKTYGVEFVSLSEQIDTATPAGKLVFTVLGAVAELERSLIGERVRMGLQAARKNGKRLGRPPIRKLGEAEVTQVRRDRATGRFSLRALAAKYQTSVWMMQQVTEPQAGAQRK